jgi:surfactin synthase thioesterase subunit
MRPSHEHEDGKLWLRQYGPATPRAVRLICFPHAGGNATFFTPLTARMPADLQVVGVQYPGRQDRHAEPPADTIAELADRIAEVLRPAVTPMAFFGHSMGSVLAFEVARRLDAAGTPVTKIFVSARCAPSLYPRALANLTDDRAIMTELKQLGGTQSVFFEDDELFQMVLPAIRSDYKAIREYRCQAGVRITPSITALMGDDDPHTTVTDMRAWADHTSGDFTLQVFSGGHFYLTEHLDEIAETLRSGLSEYIGKM